MKEIDKLVADGDLQGVQALHESGFSLTEEHLDDAFIYGYVDLVRCLMTVGINLNPRKIEKAGIKPTDIIGDAKGNVSAKSLRQLLRKATINEKLTVQTQLEILIGKGSLTNERRLLNNNRLLDFCLDTKIPISE